MFCLGRTSQSSSFIRRPCVETMAGSAGPSNTVDGSAVDQEARDVLLALAERIRELEEQVSQLQTLSKKKVEGTLAQMLKK